MAKMIVVIALANLFGDGREKIAGHGDRIKLPESDAQRLKDLGLAKFADKAQPADNNGQTKKPNGKEKNGAGSDATGTDNGTGGAGHDGDAGAAGTGDATGTGNDAGDGTSNGSNA